MKYSIIIPTMYFHTNQLGSMINMYNSLDCVGEILIINNNQDLHIQYDSYEKVRTIGTGKNLYVNPSWELGVKSAKFDNVILANDDITIKGNLNELLTLAAHLLREGVIFGPASSCYYTTKFYKDRPLHFERAVTRDKYTINYGFGVFMLMKRSTFLNTSIDENFLIWFGDHILFLQNEAWHFEGIKIITSMQGTTSKLDLRQQKVIEQNTFRKIRNEKAY